ncbi:MAG TPA: outer membrane beta-barrel protein [Saprospiraceae bacterium]|nr:outer membrane beta-barrel protein [Saprospiraceae bacterium]
MEDRIKKYFDNLEVPYNPEHWNQMEQRMSIEELSDYTNKEDEAFDNFIKKELVFEEPAFNQMHWEMMAEKLEERSWRGVVYRYKITEVGLMLLLLFTIWFSILPHEEPIQLTAVNMGSRALPIEPTISNSAKLKTAIHNKSESGSARKSSLSSLASIVQISIKDRQIENNNKRGLEGLGNFISDTKIKNYSSPNKSLLAYSQKNVYNKELTSQVLSLEKHIQYTKPSGNVRIGVFAASGIESITPEEITGVNIEPNLAFGYGGGVSLGLKFKDMEFETGASYNALVPMHISEDALATRSSVKNSTIKSDEPANKFLKLPFALKYLFDNEGSWKFYALGGGNVHIDVNSHEWQQRSNSYTFDSRSLSADQSLSSNQLSQGSTFFDRFYYTASIGFGVEKQISEKISLFLQPEYYHQLYKPTISLGVGQTNTFALAFGLKSTL